MEEKYIVEIVYQLKIANKLKMLEIEAMISTTDKQKGIVGVDLDAFRDELDKIDTKYKEEN